jgi:hypothetical protein
MTATHSALAAGGSPGIPVPARSRRGEASRTSLDLEALEASFELLARQGDALMNTFHARLFAVARRQTAVRRD